MTEPATHTLLKLTTTGEYVYEEAKVLAFAERNDLAPPWAKEPGDVVLAVFEAVYDSQIGNELFYGLNDDSGMELFTRREDE